MPKPNYGPPHNSTQNTDPNALTPSISTASTASHFSHHVADLRRENSSSSFTPTPSISGPIPPLPPRQYHQPPRETYNRDQYRESTASSRRPSLRDSHASTITSPTATKYSSHASLNNSLPENSLLSNSPQPNPGSSSGHSTPTSSTVLPRVLSSASHMSMKSNSSAGSYSIPHRGSVASIRTNDPLPPLPNQHTAPSIRSSLYSVIDDGHSLSSTRTNKSTAEFSLERPTDDAIIEQMFNDLIVSYFPIYKKSLCLLTV